MQFLRIENFYGNALKSGMNAPRQEFAGLGYRAVGKQNCS